MFVFAKVTSSAANQPGRQLALQLATKAYQINQNSCQCYLKRVFTLWRLFIDCLFFILNLRFSHFVIKCNHPLPPPPLHFPPSTVYKCLKLTIGLLCMWLFLSSFTNSATDIGKLETNIEYFHFCWPFGSRW